MKKTRVGTEKLKPIMEIKCRHVRPQIISREKIQQRDSWAIHLHKLDNQNGKQCLEGWLKGKIKHTQKHNDINHTTKYFLISLNYTMNYQFPQVILVNSISQIPTIKSVR